MAEIGIWDQFQKDRMNYFSIVIMALSNALSYNIIKIIMRNFNWEKITQSDYTFLQHVKLYVLAHLVHINTL